VVAGTAPRVSIVMNCLNGERYLREAINSVYAQTQSDWEIIFWDNGSTDTSAAIARSYDARVRYFRAEETTPLGHARMLALRQAAGDFIAFLDVDDVWLPDALERLLAGIEDGHHAICYGGVVRVDSDGRETGRYQPAAAAGNLLDSLLRNFNMFISAVLIRRAALVESGLTFDSRITASEEYCLFMQLAPRYTFRALADPIVRYRVHEGALTSRTMGKWAEEREYTLRRLIESDRGLLARHRSAFREAFARARYYRARWLIVQGRRRDALAELSRTVFVSPRYAALFAMLLMGTWCWDAVHRARTRRVSFA
jgi:glycosyltransferase involved in cell wall biosynthesis